MKINKSFIIDFLTFKVSRPLKVRELSKEIGVSAKDYNYFKSLVRELIDEGSLVKLRRGKIGIPSAMNLVVGNVSISKKGIGSIFTDSGELIEIPAEKLFTALNGDKVVIRAGRSDSSDLYGTVIKIVERAGQNIIGIFIRRKNICYVIPDDRRIRRDIIIPSRLTRRASDGDRVVVKITEWEEPSLSPEGKIVEVLGDPEKPGVDLKTVMVRFNIPETFPRKVEKEAEKLSGDMIKDELANRTDFTKEITYTIDPADAKDHDDAVSVTKTKEGYRLGVYIADVSFFVTENSILDKEALSRGNSVYLPGMVIPMLPEKISNDLCSLKPNRKRLVYAAIIDFDNSGKMLNCRLTDGVILSRAKLSYEEVEAFFQSGVQSKRLEKVASSVTLARELAIKLQKKRILSGSLDFDLPEARIVMNKKGEVVEIGNRVRLESHRLVEEFMLAANKAVALHFSRLGAKLLYRVHEKPNMEKLNNFSYMMTKLGHKFPVSENVNPLQFAKFLNKIKGRPEEGLINELMLRSMQKAVYQIKNFGHFGLAFKHYAHFTSPIRRYPDLIVHRLLRKLKNGRYPAEFNKKSSSMLTNIGRHCSETERNAEAAEREAIKYKQTIFMKSKVGDEFGGVISGMLNFGFFVRIDNIGAEGMVRMSSLGDDYYMYDEKHHRMVGRRGGRIYRVGDPVRVRVINVDITKNEIDLSLLKADTDFIDPVKKKKGKRGINMARKKKRRRR